MKRKLTIGLLDRMIVIAKMDPYKNDKEWEFFHGVLWGESKNDWDGFFCYRGYWEHTSEYTTKIGNNNLSFGYIGIPSSGLKDDERNTKSTVIKGPAILDDRIFHEHS